MDATATPIALLPEVMEPSRIACHSGIQRSGAVSAVAAARHSAGSNSIRASNMRLSSEGIAARSALALRAEGRAVARVHLTGLRAVLRFDEWSAAIETCAIVRCIPMCGAPHCGVDHAVVGLAITPGVLVRSRYPRHAAGAECARPPGVPGRDHARDTTR